MSSRHVIILFRFDSLINNNCFGSEANLALEPYKVALSEVTNSINDQLEKIASLKRKITINEEKTTKLIFGIVKRI